MRYSSTVCRMVQVASSHSKEIISSDSIGTLKGAKVKEKRASSVAVGVASNGFRVGKRVSMLQAPGKEMANEWLSI